METFAVRGLSFAYPEQRRDTLRELSFSIPQGQFVTLCGPSGCGKSTLLRQLKTVLAPTGDRRGIILFEGIPLDEVGQREQSARIGTLAHAMIRASLLGEPFDAENADPAELSQAEEAFRCFLRWREGHSLRPVHCERSFVSEALRYGGTPDCYCILDGAPVLLDFKTGKRIYDEYFVQLAAYARLLREQGYPVRELRVLRLGRTEEDCEERSVTEQEKWFYLFENLLNIYYLRKDLAWRS